MSKVISLTPWLQASSRAYQQNTSVFDLKCLGTWNVTAYLLLNTWNPLGYNLCHNAAGSSAWIIPLINRARWWPVSSPDKRSFLFHEIWVFHKRNTASSFPDLPINSYSYFQPLRNFQKCFSSKKGSYMGVKTSILSCHCMRVYFNPSRLYKV